MKGKVKGYAVFVSYYENYFKYSLSRFERLLNRTFGDNYELVVVFNGAKDENAKLRGNYHSVSGSNSGWEFSAWDEGISFFESRKKLSKDDVFIFANDTFCQHRPFTALSEFVFASSFRKINDSNCIVGEEDSIREKFTINGYRANSWVSTYLFGMSYSNVELLLPFNYVGENVELSQAITIGEGNLYIPKTSDSILQHLSSWFFGGTDGWYKKENADTELLNKKIQAVVNEKLLSARANSLNILLCDVYHSKASSFIRKLHNRFLNKFVALLR